MERLRMDGEPTPTEVCEGVPWQAVKLVIE
jgi:hypothetical protein